MTRRRRGGNGGQGPAPAKLIEEGKKVRSDDVRKRFLMYECSNENCGKKWNSFHGWKVTDRNHREDCQHCRFGIGKMTGMKEETADLDRYSCAGCNRIWSRLPPKDGQQATCGNDCDPADITLNGTQLRHCKIITFKCNKSECAIEWTSANLGKEYSQRCRDCNKIGVVRGSGVSNDDKKKEGYGKVPRGIHGGGEHNVDGCDMCDELKPYGLTCTSKNRVKVEEFLTPDGSFKTSVSLVFYGRGYRCSPRKREGNMDSAIQKSGTIKTNNTEC